MRRFKVDARIRIDQLRRIEDHEANGHAGLVDGEEGREDEEVEALRALVDLLPEAEVVVVGVLQRSQALYFLKRQFHASWSINVYCILVCEMDKESFLHSNDIISFAFLQFDTAETFIIFFFFCTEP